MADSVACPFCGSSATLPLPGLGDKVGTVLGLAFARRGQDLTFGNHDLVRKFRAGQIEAVCKACRKRFHQRTAAAEAGPPAGPARPAVERLRELEQLRAEGLLSEDEYRAKRADILRGV